jgi:tRNA(Leu) C34 or U34 (ribose-2'-O)-methylase TrmL
MKRGFAGIALYEPKLIKNLGTLMRSVHCFGFQFVCTIGSRYSRRESADTTNLVKHVPVILENVCDHTVRIDTSYCLNQAVCASIIMYDRVVKLG